MWAVGMGSSSTASTPRWGAADVALSAAVFVGSGLLEICGGYLVWEAVRGGARGSPRWWVVPGSLMLVAYGFAPTLQPQFTDFARVYAAYGGVFVAMSYLFGVCEPMLRPSSPAFRLDTGDWVGGGLALVGCALAFFWPRDHDVPPETSPSMYAIDDGSSDSP